MAVVCNASFTTAISRPTLNITLIYLMWMRLTRTSVTPLRKQPKRLSHAGECESLYKTFLQSPQGDDSSLAATALLAKFDRKRRDRWSEAVRSIDFSHSSRKAWSILNNLTGRSRHSPRHCPVSADAMHLSWLEMGNTRLLTASHLDLSIKKCLTFGRPQHQTQ